MEKKCEKSPIEQSHIGRTILVYILVCLFGVGSWVSINGLWVELPILVTKLPEQVFLPSYIVVVTQVANIGPIAYAVGNMLWPKKVHEISAVYVMLAVGCISSFLLTFFWEETSYIIGEYHSIALLSLVFLLSLVDCSSSIVFVPFMAMFKEKYLPAYLVGEGLSGLIPSAVALLQGAGNPECLNVSIVNQTIDKHGHAINITTFVMEEQSLSPIFPAETFFIFLFVMMVICGVSFVMLNYHPWCKMEQVPILAIEEEIEMTEISIIESYRRIDPDELPEPERRYSLLHQTENTQDIYTLSTLLDSEVKRKHSKTGELPEVKKLSQFQYIFLLFAHGWISALSNTGLLGIQSFSCMPYGNTAYHLAVSLSTMANPIACFLLFVVSTKSVAVVATLTMIGNGFAAYIIALAYFSPNPPMKDELLGEILMIGSWILCVGILSYAKVLIAAILRDEGRKALMWYGSITQVGSAIGAIIMFVVVNLLNIFQGVPACGAI